MTKQVLLRAPVLTQSGYGVHARQLFSWLTTKNVDLFVQVLPWGDTPWFINPNEQNGLIGNVMSCTKPLTTQADVTVQLQLPNEWDPSLGKFNVGVTAGVETTVCNPEWIVACNKMDLVIVPSTHVKQTLEASGKLTVPVFVVPESFPNSFLSEHAPLDLGELPEFNFVVFGQITGQTFHSDRKGVFTSIKWLCEAFKGRNDVGIIVKTNMGRNTLIDRKLTTMHLQQVVKESRGGLTMPNVKLLHGYMSDDEIAALYAHPRVKAAVAVTKGEGFGLQILEAAAMGVPVIATGWSGHMDFMSAGKFINVMYQLGDVHKSRIDDKIFINGAKWAHPSEEDFKRRAKKLVDSYEAPKQWATELAEKIRASHNELEIRKQYDSIEILSESLA